MASFIRILICFHLSIWILSFSVIGQDSQEPHSVLIVTDDTDLSDSRHTYSTEGFMTILANFKSITVDYAYTLWTPYLNTSCTTTTNTNLATCLHNNYLAILIEAFGALDSSHIIGIYQYVSLGGRLILSHRELTQKLSQVLPQIPFDNTWWDSNYRSNIVGDISCTLNPNYMNNSLPNSMVYLKYALDQYTASGDAVLMSSVSGAYDQQLMYICTCDPTSIYPYHTPFRDDYANSTFAPIRTLSVGDGFIIEFDFTRMTTESHDSFRRVIAYLFTVGSAFSLDDLIQTEKELTMNWWAWTSVICGGGLVVFSICVGGVPNITKLKEKTVNSSPLKLKIKYGKNIVQFGVFVVSGMMMLFDVGSRCTKFVNLLDKCGGEYDIPDMAGDDNMALRHRIMALPALDFTFAVIIGGLKMYSLTDFMRTKNERDAEGVIEFGWCAFGLDVVFYVIGLVLYVFVMNPKLESLTDTIEYATYDVDSVMLWCGYNTELLDSLQVLHKGVFDMYLFGDLFEVLIDIGNIFL
eukprot:158246_1